MGEPAVELVNVTKRFDEVIAVDNVSLRIEDGEFFSLLGPSGCGKTTTLRMIAGFETPIDGEVFIQGELMGLTPPFQRRTYNELFQEHTGIDPADKAAVAAYADKIGFETAGKHPDVVKNEVFEEKVEDQLTGPVFVMD